MKFDKQGFREAAEKATEGNYVVGHCDINRHGNLSSVYVCQEWNGEAGGVVAECHVNCLTKNSDQVYANAGFMAFASPMNVIALLDEINTLEARCAALAAEVYDLKHPGTYLPSKRETPALDAFLAEVRAQGVDSAINTVIAMMNHQHPVTSKAIDILRVHAYQLRKGVQS
ncbi:ead/Ea22-like family protein [Enterobacter roggenkampii]|uniref:ead/Ea22-like family protein n=1 Tax=Enterobacter roggenkampii TaxID=1812935 RepID=UPI002A7F75C1|nr:ead/Ea22-like family protein [Enterobacter roggenkampii]